MSHWKHHKKKKQHKKSVYAFVDNENVNVSVQKQWWKPDWGKIYNRLCKEYNAEKVYMFMGYHPDFELMYEFFGEIGYELVFRKMHTGEGAPMKWNIDTELVLQAMIDYTAYDKAVIVSGDGDFACLIKYLQDNKKLKALVVPNKHRYSSFFHDVIDEKEIVAMTDYKKKLKYTKNSKTNDIMKKVKEARNDTGWSLLDDDDDMDDVPFWM